jgi:hypothetical protein
LNRAWNKDSGCCWILLGHNLYVGEEITKILKEGVNDGLLAGIDRCLEGVPKGGGGNAGRKMTRVE